MDEERLGKVWGNREFMSRSNRFELRLVFADYSISKSTDPRTREAIIEQPVKATFEGDYFVEFER